MPETLAEALAVSRRERMPATGRSAGTAWRPATSKRARPKQPRASGVLGRRLRAGRRRSRPAAPPGWRLRRRDRACAGCWRRSAGGARAPTIAGTAPLPRARRRAGRAGRAHAAARSGAGRRPSTPTTPRAIEAVVARGPEETGNGTRLVVDLTRDRRRRAARGTLALSVPSGWPDFGPGETIACRARLRALRGTRNPGLPDPALALRAVGIDALGGRADRRRHPRAWPSRPAADRGARPSWPGAPCAPPIDRAVGGRGRRVPQDGRARRPARRRARGRGGISRRRRHARAVGLGAAPGGGGGAVLPRWCAAAAARVPAAAALRSIRAPSRPPPRCRRSPSSPCSPGEAVATERSALMLAIGMGALLVGRAASPGPTIAGAALILLVARPLQIFDVSLQLSVASVAGIALCARRLGPARGRAPASLARRALRWLVAVRRRDARRHRRDRAARRPLSSARWRRWRRSATWRWCRWSSWRSSRSGLAGATPARDLAAARALPLRWPPRPPRRLALAIAGGFRAHAPALDLPRPERARDRRAHRRRRAGAGRRWRRAAAPRRLLAACALAAALVAAASLAARDLAAPARARR